MHDCYVRRSPKDMLPGDVYRVIDGFLVRVVLSVVRDAYCDLIMVTYMRPGGTIDFWYYTEEMTLCVMT